jgi:hypothetical protein
MSVDINPFTVHQSASFVSIWRLERLLGAEQKQKRRFERSIWPGALKAAQTKALTPPRSSRS